MSSDNDIPSVKPKKKVKLSMTAKNENGGHVKTKKPAVVKSESTATKKKRKREAEPEPVKSSTTKKKKLGAATNASGGAVAPKKELKKLDKSERLQYAMQSFLWWNAKEPPEGCQWVTMEHAGVSFPEPYQPHGVKLLYEGKPIDLNPLQEEA
jgi:DNA topoisomerase I